MDKDTKKVPMRSEIRVPSLSFDRPTAGEIKSDWEIDMPPINAYSS